MREKLDWNLAGKLFALALLMDIVLWAAVTYNYWGEISFSSREAMLDHLENLSIYILNSLVATVGAMVYTNFINKVMGGRRTLGKLIVRRTSTLVLILLTSTLLSVLYVKLGMENENDAVLTGLSVSLISFFIAQIYATKKYFSDQVDFEQRKLIAELSKRRLQTDNHFIYNCMGSLKALMRTDVDAAEKFISSMSQGYRYLTIKSQETLASVKEETEFLIQHCRLLRWR